MNYLICSLIVGVVATLVMDLWGALRKPLFGMPAADYRLVGRWLSHLARGRFQHESIAKSPAARGEVLTGWIGHYLLGVAFAAAFIWIVGADWLRRPTLGAALIFGLITVLVPFMVMQPAMGMGMAARRTPRPTAARLQSLITHGVFGAGLYIGGRVASAIYSTGE